MWRVKVFIAGNKNHFQYVTESHERAVASAVHISKEGYTHNELNGNMVFFPLHTIASISISNEGD